VSSEVSPILPDVSDALKAKVGSVETDLCCGPRRLGEGDGPVVSDVVRRGVADSCELESEIGCAGKTKCGFGT